MRALFVMQCYVLCGQKRLIGRMVDEINEHKFQTSDLSPRSVTAFNQLFLRALCLIFCFILDVDINSD